MEDILIKQATLVNEGKRWVGDLWIRQGRIERMGSRLDPRSRVREIEAEGLFLIPGVIDDQVHFREPGLTHKANIASESAAAVAGGVTSFMEMPNTRPPALTLAALEEKYARAAQTSLANYSFYLGASNDNAEEVLRANEFLDSLCGIKVFMGSSTGNMLVDQIGTLETIFSESRHLITTHCEQESVIATNRLRYAQADHVSFHPLIRDEQACYQSTELAVGLARKYGSRLHVLHISTQEEISLFDSDIPLEEKRITSEVCVHHLHFSAEDYGRYGNLIQCNPAIKAPRHREALWKGLKEGKLDLVATDHAPHTWEEKQQPYPTSPSGIPLVQYSLLLMLDYVRKGEIRLEDLVEKMCHAPALCFQILQRGFLREGYWADLVLVDPGSSTRVDKADIKSLCGWSPFEGHVFSHRIDCCFVNGNPVFEQGRLNPGFRGKRLEFSRK